MFSSKEEMITFVNEQEARLKVGEGPAMEEASRLNKELSAKLVWRYRALLWGQILAYALVVLAASLLYIRFTPRRT
ncbi:hypothetical protein D9M70_590560 [compost metagenome]